MTCGWQPLNIAAMQALCQRILCAQLGEGGNSIPERCQRAHKGLCINPKPFATLLSW